MVETITLVRPRKKTNGKNERRFTRIYHLENDKSQKVRVCQKMFLSPISLVKQLNQLGQCCQKVEIPGQQMMYLIKGKKLNLQTEKQSNFRLG